MYLLSRRGAIWEHATIFATLNLVCQWHLPVPIDCGLAGIAWGWHHRYAPRFNDLLCTWLKI